MNSYEAGEAKRRARDRVEDLKAEARSAEKAYHQARGTTSKEGGFGEGFDAMLGIEVRDNAATKDLLVQWERAREAVREAEADLARAKGAEDAARRNEDSSRRSEQERAAQENARARDKRDEERRSRAAEARSARELAAQEKAARVDDFLARQELQRQESMLEFEQEREVQRAREAHERDEWEAAAAAASEYRWERQQSREESCAPDHPDFWTEPRSETLAYESHYLFVARGLLKKHDALHRKYARSSAPAELGKEAGHHFLLLEELEDAAKDDPEVIEAMALVDVLRSDMRRRSGTQAHPGRQAQLGVWEARNAAFLKRQKACRDRLEDLATVMDEEEDAADAAAKRKKDRLELRGGGAALLAFAGAGALVHWLQGSGLLP